MSKRKNHDTFIKEVYDLVNDEYVVLGNYINNKKRIRIET